MACFAILAVNDVFAAKKSFDGKRLDEVLASQTDDVKARYEFRHPKKTLEFIGIAPGMTVVEVLPGAGWYSQILAPYLGKKGKLVGADYEMDLWPNFEWMNDKFLQERKDWLTTFSEEVESWGHKAGAKGEAYTLETLPKKLKGKADAVLFIRALHNMARFESKGQFLTNSLAEAHRVLKKGGILAVVQHETSDKSANGATGYLEKQFVMDAIAQAGFKFVAESSINANPKDKADGIVWRLPPSYYGMKDDDPKKKEYTAIGESNRMTLKFVKIAKR